MGDSFLCLLQMREISLLLLRCLLSKKAGPVMNIIKEIFTTIHKFHFQLTSSVWEGPVSTAHAKMCETHRRFHQRAQFLFTGKNITEIEMLSYISNIYTHTYSGDKISPKRISTSPGGLLTKTQLQPVL